MKITYIICDEFIVVIIINDIYIYIYMCVWGGGGQKVLEASAHSISSPRPTLRRKKCLGTNEGNPDC